MKKIFHLVIASIYRLIFACTLFDTHTHTHRGTVIHWLGQRPMTVISWRGEGKEAGWLYWNLHDRGRSVNQSDGWILESEGCVLQSWAAPGYSCVAAPWYSCSSIKVQQCLQHQGTTAAAPGYRSACSRVAESKAAGWLWWPACVSGPVPGREEERPG